MILTEEQVRIKAAEYALKNGDDIDGTMNNDYNGYKNGWNDCQEYYKELIEMGMLWKEKSEKYAEIFDKYR